tara:strand:+ start:357 stop:800 length:444 start_codon:yes stop_codon:yes gene_type:complete
MSTIVGTNIEVTNLKYDSDTTSMIISNTGQVTIQGEGTATTNLQQGLTKQWTSFNQETPEVFNSFNLSSMTDRTTGKTQHNFTNNMTGQKLYSVSGMTLDEGESQAVMDGCDNDYTSSSVYEVNTMDTTNAARDCDHGYTMVCGDLA